jgi:hypothetical protein
MLKLEKKTRRTKRVNTEVEEEKEDHTRDMIFEISLFLNNI